MDFPRHHAPEKSGLDEPLYSCTAVQWIHAGKCGTRGLKKQIEGDTLHLTLTPEQAYGEHKEGQQQRVPIKHLQGLPKGVRNWKPGMVAVVQTDQGMRQVTVVKPGLKMVLVDTNHPLAGKTLTYDIEVVSVRPATDEEIAHGHAHGVGGHHH